jgi:predicted dehydrogenase
MFAELTRDMAHLGRIVAVAEPREAYRQTLARDFGLDDGNVFKSWEEFCARPRLCDAVLIATMDREHVGPAVACLDKGYDVLLEKPMGVTLDECRAIEQAQRRSGRIVGVCHSLRYQKGFRKLKELVASGVIGQLVTLDQIEQVMLHHHAHSFVRGNWGNESRSAFMLLAKSCHDLDFIAWLVGKPCLSVTSYGSLSYFTRVNAPAGATDRCTDGCPHEPACSFSAIKQYVQTDRARWWADVVSADHSYEAHMNAIRTGPYGRCVWKCDNDAVDHQVVAMQFEGGITATFTMTAFTQASGRKIRLHGTLGEIAFDESTITIRTFADNNTQTIQISPESGAHGGGDARLLRDWLTALHTRDDATVVANAQESLKSHTIVFAAEKSRRENRSIRLTEL